MNATINPESGFTSVQIEYGLTSGYGNLAPEPPIELVSNTQVKDVRFQVGGLEPGTNYHYRVVATNLAGVTKSSSDLTFRTFDFSPVLEDPCPNALARQQTGAALLLDCRGYELVSAANAGGYNVESDLIPGQEPFARVSACGRPRPVRDAQRWPLGRGKPDELRRRSLRRDAQQRRLEHPVRRHAVRRNAVRRLRSRRR